MIKKQGTIHNQRDQQFQVQTLVDYSSEQSSKKDEQNEIKYQDASDEEKCSKKSIKSLEDIPSPEGQKEDKNILIIDHKNLRKSQYDEYRKEDKIKRFQLKTLDDSELPYESEIKKKRRKRQQIFKNLKLEKQRKGLEQQLQRPNNSKQVFNRIAFEKKRENHTSLKHWNYCRIRNLQFHRSIGEQLIKSLDQNVKSSLQNLEVYKTFFVQRYRQEQAYANTIFADSDRYLDNDQEFQENIHSSNIYMGCSSMLQALGRKIKKQKEIAIKFAKLIQTQILKEIFQEYFDKVRKQSLSLRDKISQVKSNLEKVDISICKKLVQLETVFTECCQDVNKQSDKDFYRAELSFLRKCQAEMSLEARYGLLIIQYYHYAMSQEEIRKQLIDKSLKIFNDALTQYNENLKNISKYGAKSQTTQLSVKSLSLFPTTETNQLFSLQNMLSQELQQKIVENLHSNGDQSPRKQKKDININEFNEFFIKCESDEFNCHHLIMRKFQVEIQKQNKWIPGYIIITVDKFVHIFLNSSSDFGGVLYGAQVYFKPEATIKANFISLQLRNSEVVSDQIENDEELEIVITNKKTQSSLGKLKSLMKISQKIEETVRFLKESDLLQFQDYIADLSL